MSATTIKASSPRAQAQSCLLTNLLVLPGLGTWLAGKRLAGACQMILAGTGFVLSVWYIAWFVRTWHSTGEAPFEDYRYLWVALAGIGSFLIGWGWGMVVGVRLVRRVKYPPPIS